MAKSSMVIKSNNFFNEFVKEQEDEFLTLAADGISAAEFDGYTDTGCYALNALISADIYNGFPNNKIIAMAGETSTGKTYLALSIVKTFLEKNTSAGVIYFDTEAAVTKEMMASRGIDVSRVIVSEPSTIEEFRHKAVKYIDSLMEKKDRPEFLFVLDSLGMLSSSKELGDITEGTEKRDMTKPQLLRGAFRVLRLKLAKARIPMIVTNHTYDVTGSYVPTKEMAGGGGLKFAADYILFLSKKKDKGDGKEVIGNILKVRLIKSRLSRENKEVELRLSYDTGIDKFWGLLEIAERHGIVKKVGNRYEFPDGTKAFAKDIDRNPEKYYTPEILETINNAVHIEYSYGDQREKSLDGDDTETND